MRIKYYYVYIAKCSDNSYYTGFTNNPERRIEEHNKGRNRKAYTYDKRPVVLVYEEAFSDPVAGIEFEKQVKGWSRKKKELLISGKRELLPEEVKSQKKAKK